MQSVIPAPYHAPISRVRRRSGFTLIEVMVTLALTMIMMAMFASIFKLTGDFVTRQKGIGENDQSARIVSTLLKNDLQARTTRYLAAYLPSGAAVLPASTYTSSRSGYFYYSENNPLDDTDDVLQFTVYLPNLPSNNPISTGQIYGLATNLPLPWQPGTTYAANALVRPAGTTASSQPTGFVYKNEGTAFTSAGTEPSWSSGTPALNATLNDNGGTWTTVPSALDQADGDDGVMSYLATTSTETINPPNANPNNTGVSQYAEIAWFLRHGNLYRRVLPIRNPYNLTGNAGSQPKDTQVTPLIPAQYPPNGYTTTNNFWTDFDYSGRIMLQTGVAADAGNSSIPIGFAFHGLGSPENSLYNTPQGITATPPPGTNGAMPMGPPWPFGRPDNRFGHDQTNGTMSLTAPLTGNGAPREFDSSTPPVFFGRYTHEETSNLNFVFPGNLPSPGTTPAGNSPMAQSTTVNLDSTGRVITQYQSGSRRGEDIILTNVLAFDVKILDNFYSENAGSDLNRDGVIETTPGPAFVDVGHTAPTGVFRQQAINSTLPAPATNAAIAYGPFAGSTYATSTPPYTYQTTVAGTTYTYNRNNIFDTWHPQFDFDGDGIPDPPPYTGLPNTNDGIGATFNGAPHPYWAANTAYSVGTIVIPPATSNIVNGYQYVCVSPGTSGTAPPFSNSDNPTPGATPVQDPPGGANMVQWQCVPPVQAIQITVKYLDPSQNLLRQVTIVQQLTQ
jgi:prepilin-type N-terminal cleavage/methylation domain-containing protein